MHTGNETITFDCRFLDDSYVHALLDKFIEAFSDYSRPFDFDAEKFRSHIVRNAVDLSRSVGCFLNGEMIGFSLNGFGNWRGKPTVYDAGTGVIPGHRRRGSSRAMFDFMLPILREGGAEQFLLEVITDNSPAVNLYTGFGFEIQRELLLLEAPGELAITGALDADVEVRPAKASEIGSLEVFGIGIPSWQNSDDAITRSGPNTTTLGAFIDGQCVGYNAFSTGLGRIGQFGVHEHYRGKGIASRLLAEMRSRTDDGNLLQVINIDRSLAGAVKYFENRGFQKALAQYEMLMPL